MERIYMDHAATTAISEAALTAMVSCYRERDGNPSAIYPLGQDSQGALEKARIAMAKGLHALSTEIFFTSGGTEGNNWVLSGVARAKGRGHIVTTAIEHNSVLKTAARLEEGGFEVTYLQPDRFGFIAPEQLEAALRPDTILVSVMLANNVVGTIQDTPALVKVAHARWIPFHTDAVQAVGHIPINVRRLGADFLTLSAHKFHGPKGVGALFCRLSNYVPPLILGGGQERGGRSGTENVPGAVGMAAAFEECLAGLDEDTAYLTKLRRRLTEGMTAIPGVRLTGDPERRLPGLASFIVDGIPHSAHIVYALGGREICVSSGSACSVGSQEASHVLKAMGFNMRAAMGALRFSLDVSNTEEEVDRVLAVIPGVIEEVRAKKGSLWG